MASMKIPALVFLALATVAAAPARAAEHEGEFHRFHAAVLLGGSHNGELNALTFGGDIEFRPIRPIGIGLTGEHVNEPFRENVWIVPVIVHPTRLVKLSIGPGFERNREGADPRHIEQHALLRLGAALDLPLGHGWTVDPDVAVDFVKGERVVVYAVALGKEFGGSHGGRHETAAHQAKR